jgi:hypothetical protein
MCAFFVGARVITSVSGQQTRRSTQFALMGCHCRKQQVPITGRSSYTFALISLYF